MLYYQGFFGGWDPIMAPMGGGFVWEEKTEICPHFTPDRASVSAALLSRDLADRRAKASGERRQRTLTWSRILPIGFDTQKFIIVDSPDSEIVAYLLYPHHTFLYRYVFPHITNFSCNITSCPYHFGSLLPCG